MQAQRLAAARGVIWVLNGFLLYRRGPALLTLLTMFYLLVAIGCGIIEPIGPFLLPLLLPTLTALVSNACRLLDPSQTVLITRGALWHGIKTQRGPLLHLGALQLAGTVAVLGIDLLLAGGDWADLGKAEEAGPLHLLRLLLLASPMLLAFWFAPLLTAWDAVPPAKSLFFSLIAALRNWRAFLAYGGTVLVIAAALPALLMAGASLISSGAVLMLSALLRMLMILIFAPVLMASVYLSYRDIFKATPQAAAALTPTQEAGSEHG